MELQPRLKYLPLAKAVFGWPGAPGSSRSFTMSRSPLARPVPVSDRLCHVGTAAGPGGPGPGLGAETKEGHAAAGTAPLGRRKPHRRNGRIDTPREWEAQHAWAAQISRFSTRLQRKMIKSFNEQIGGSARVLASPLGDLA